MTLTNEQILQLQSSNKFRRLAALEFTKSFASIHRNIPIQEEGEVAEDFNKRVDAYNRHIGVKPSLEKNIADNGVLSIFATNVLLAALSTYSISFTGETEDGLIDKVLDHVEDGSNAITLETTKILKGESFRAQKIV